MKSSFASAIPAEPDTKILVRSVNWLGDAIMTTPALMRLREARPMAHIALLTPGKLKDLWKGHPAIDEVLETQPSLWKTAGMIRRMGFHAALILPNSPRSALEAWLAGIPRRIGCRYPWRNWLLTHAVPINRSKPVMRKRSLQEIEQLSRDSEGRRGTFPLASHQMHHYLHTVGAIGGNPEPLPPTIHVEAMEIEQACERFQIRKNPGRPVFGLNPGAEYGPAKRWPRERFAQAAFEIQKRTGCLWLVFGGKNDVPAALEITNSIGKAGCSSAEPLAICLAGKTTLRELCALLKHSSLLLTNDTGPMHVAAAVNTPVIVPFGSTSFELTGPGLPGDTRHRLIAGPAACAPCFLRECPIDFRCMNRIDVETVVKAVLEVWAGKPR